jgi:hypothetical protein
LLFSGQRDFRAEVSSLPKPTRDIGGGDDGGWIAD